MARAQAKVKLAFAFPASVIARWRLDAPVGCLLNASATGRFRVWCNVRVA